MADGLLWRLWDTMWRRMKNPWVFWGRTLLGLALLPAVWYRCWPAIAGILVLTTVVGFCLPFRERTSGLIPRMVDGTRTWLSTAPPVKVAALMVVGVAIAAVMLWALWTHHTTVSVVAVPMLIVYKTSFLLNAAKLAPQTGGVQEEAERGDGL
jgi:hypothetical protein